MRWAPLNGWKRRADGWLVHPEYVGWLRSTDGRWYAEADADEGLIEMTPAGPRIVPGWLVVRGQWMREASEDPLDELRRRLEQVTTDG